MKRILVLGSSGAGKTTFARKLGHLLDIPVIHLDAHYWQPDWTSLPSAEWSARLGDLLSRDRWVMDGNYVASLRQRIAYADTIVFLDRSRMVCLWRCLHRLAKYRGRNRPELAPGCNEKIDWAFFKWIWDYPRDIRPQIRQDLSSLPDGKTVIWLGCEQEVASFLKELKEQNLRTERSQWR